MKLEKNRETKISGDFHSMTDEGFPRPICLELADLEEAKDHEKEVLDALYSFSNKQLYRSRCPHDIEEKGNEKKFFRKMKKGKREYQFNKVWSLDLVSRRDLWRIIYAFDELRGVYKILSLRHNTH